MRGKNKLIKKFKLSFLTLFTFEKVLTRTSFDFWYPSKYRPKICELKLKLLPMITKIYVNVRDLSPYYTVRRLHVS